MDWAVIFDNTVEAFVGINACYFALAAIGLNVQFGYAGLLNFGQAAFMACGAYGIGMAAHYFGYGFWWGLLFGLVYTVALALLLGIPTLRLRADYLAIVTIAAAEIVRLVVQIAAVHVAVRRLRRHPGLLRHLPRARRRRTSSRPIALPPADRRADPQWRLRPVRVRRAHALDVGDRLDPRRHLWTGRLPADAQPVGPSDQGHPRGRDGGRQPRQERVRLQDVGADHRRCDRACCRA